MYAWTRKAEKAAQHLGLEEKKEGQVAKLGSLILTEGKTVQAWLKKGYIKEVEKTIKI